MRTNTTIILVAAAFGAIGFTLGRVTAPQPSLGSTEVVKILKTEMGTETVTASGSGEVEVIVESLGASGFEGDTTIAIPGGAAMISRSGNQIEVSVEVTE